MNNYEWNLALQVYIALSHALGKSGFVTCQKPFEKFTVRMNIVVFYRNCALWICSFTILLVGVKIVLQYFHN